MSGSEVVPRQTSIHHMNFVLPSSITAQLSERYRQPHRFYHTLTHIQDMLAQLQRHSNLVKHVETVIAAIWFHDAIYDTKHQDNELQSALLAQKMLNDCSAPSLFIEQVCHMVQATSRHEWTDQSSDTALFLDIDLFILGSATQAYDLYCQQIAQEYQWLPTDVYKSGRRTVLEKFLARPTIYFTPAFQANHELLARENIKRELACTDNT